MSPKISVVIPTYNETQNIVSLIKKISETMAESELMRGATAEVVIVDDNSPDGTGAACQSLGGEYCPVRVIVRTDEKGLGSAVGRGILEAAGDTIVVMDADFSHDCAMIPQMVLAVNGGPIDVVVASRFVEGGKMSSSTHLLLGSRLLNAFLRTVLALPVRDITGGFIALRRSSLQDLDFQSVFRGYGDYCIALLYKGYRRGWHLKEIPFTYGNRKVGLSKTRFLKAGVSYGLRGLKLRMGLE